MPQSTSPLERAKALAPVIEAEAAECERRGQFTERLVDTFCASRLFWVAVPEELGGEDLDVVGQIEMIEELSRADGSTGWTVMANSITTSLCATGCDDDAVKAMFPAPDDMPLIAGMVGPAGTAVREEGGLRVHGRYSFGSGSTHASWITAGVLAADGEGQLVVVVPADEVRFLGNWNVLGLAGTGSVDYALEGVLVPDAYQFNRLAFVAKRGSASFRLGLAPLAAAGHAGVALGIAKRALEEIVRVVDGGKQRPGASPVVDQPTFKRDFANNDAKVRAARAYIMEVFGDALRTVERGDSITDEQAQRVRQATTFGTELCYEAVEFAYRWAGSASLRQPSALGRCMRDMHAAIQHVYVDVNTLVNAAPALIDAYRPKSAG